MKVLKAPTYYRKKKIEDLTTAPHLIRFIKDANENWIVGKEILTDANFNFLKDEFAHLQEIDYNPVTIEP